MNVLTDETVRRVLNVAIESLEKGDDVVISKQIIIAAFSEIIESRKNHERTMYEKRMAGINGKIKWEISPDLGMSV
ncbi:hypothetical protein UXO57_20945 [Enterobacter hormaechei]